VWNFGVYLLFRAHSPQEAILYARIVQFGVIFLPISLFHLCLLVAQMPTPRLLYALYGLHALLALSNFTSWFVADVRFVGYAYYTVGGPAFWLFVLSYSLVATRTTVMMFQRQRDLPPRHRRRLRLLLGANVMLIVFGTNDILPILGVTRYPIVELTIYPLGSGAAIGYGMLVGYSALQHELLNIRITLSRLAAQLVRVLFLTLIGFLMLLLLALRAPRSFPPFAFFSALAVLAASALIATLYFPRLFGRSEAVIERWILGDEFEYRDKLRQFVRSIPFYSDTQVLMNDLHDLLVQTVGVRAYQIILLDQITQVFSLYRAHPEQPPRPLPELRSDAPLLRYFKATAAKSLAFKLSYAMPGETDLEGAARRQLGEFNPEFCFPFSSEGEPFGLLLIGEKANNQFYTRHDQELLVELVHSLGLVINQIRLKNQVLEAEELELLGRMSRGMAHDLNNLITPVWTYLQLSGLDEAGGPAQAELLPVALRSVETISAYIKEALFVSEHKKPLFKLCEVRQLVREAAGLYEPRARAKGIQLDLDAPDELPAEAEPSLIQRLLGNLLDNAIAACRPGGGIRLELRRLTPEESTRDWLRLRVIDTGEGMNSDVLRQSAAPYFTTKDSGEGHRGFGLGLAICRKIVRLHGGQLAISSAEQKGTTVQVDLPLRQGAAAGEAVPQAAA
jgi:signal transduction histidine kinase